MRVDGPLVFVGEDTPSIRSMLSDKLEASGARVHFRDVGLDSNADTKFMGGFQCAVLALERPDGNGDSIDEAELLRMYQPTLPVAFLYADAPEKVLQRARAVGPVFKKPGQIDAATAWILESCK